jgi:cytidine deaminase
MNDDLINAARAAAAHAHAPYSGFGVGAAVRLENSEIIIGCNFENAQGKLRQVREIAVIGGKLVDGTITGSAPVNPCGRCRQVINEAAQMSGHDTEIHCASADGVNVTHHRISQLLPHPFGPADLGFA